MLNDPTRQMGMEMTTERLVECSAYQIHPAKIAVCVCVCVCVCGAVRCGAVRCGVYIMLTWEVPVLLGGCGTGILVF